jgi:hypothetical protein
MKLLNLALLFLLFSCNRESLNTSDECLNITDNTAEFERLEFDTDKHSPKGSPFRRVWLSIPDKVEVEFFFGEDYYYDYCPDDCGDNNDWNKSWGLTIRNSLNSNSNAAMPADKIATGDSLITMGFYYHDVIIDSECEDRHFSDSEGVLKVDRCELLKFTIELDRENDRYLNSIYSYDQDTTVRDTQLWCNPPLDVREILRWHGGNQKPTQPYNVFIRKLN